MDVVFNLSVVLLSLVTVVWTIALILDIKAESYRMVILFDFLVILMVPVHEHLYLEISVFDVLIINGIIFLFTFIIGHKVIRMKRIGKTVKEVEDEIAEMEKN